MTATALPGGVLTATLTPILADRSPNHDLLYAHCSDLMQRGSNGIALLGTTGEANSISNAYRKEILEELISRGFPGKVLVVGTATCSLDDTIDLTRHCISLGVPNVLVMPPWYYRGAPEKGLEVYFSTLIDEVGNPDLRIYLYHFPRMSGIDMSIDLIETLCNRYGPIIAGMKDSSGDLHHMLSIIQAFPELRLYAGTEKLLLQVLDAGGVGCISATTNYGIEDASRVYSSWLEGSADLDAAARMVANRTAFEGNNFASALKAVLSGRNPGFRHILPPLTQLDNSALNTILAQLQNQ